MLQVRQATKRSRALSGVRNSMKAWRLRSPPALFTMSGCIGPGPGLSMVEIEQNGAMTTATAFDGNPQLVVPRRFKRNAPQVLAMAPLGGYRALAASIYGGAHRNSGSRRPGYLGFRLRLSFCRGHHHTRHSVAELCRHRRL